MYDWAAQPLFTIIVTFIFGPYFVNQVVGSGGNGQALWANTQAYAGFLLALTAPFLGAYADESNSRKPWVVGASILCAAACALLWFATPGAHDARLVLIIVAVIISIWGAEAAIIFNNAMLPSLTTAGRIGRLSGLGWALGYAGALLALPVMLWVTGQLPGVPGPAFEGEWAAERLTGPFVAIWLIVFMVPFMLWTPDARTSTSRQSRWKAVRRSLYSTLAAVKELPSQPNLLRYLLARMAYYDGLNAIFAFGGVYAAAQFDWGTTELGLFGIIILLFGVPGCLLGGILDDRIGAKRSLYLSVGGLFVTMTAILSIGDEKILFIVPAEFPTRETGLFATAPEWLMVGLAALLGAFAGPSQSASRTLIARLAPPEDIGKYFGLFALSGKATSFLAPLMIGLLLTRVDERFAYSVILLFLAVGLILLAGVRETRRSDARDPHLLTPPPA